MNDFKEIKMPNIEFFSTVTESGDPSFMTTDFVLSKKTDHTYLS